MKPRFYLFKKKYIYKAGLYLSQCVCDVFTRIELHGYENIPEAQPCVIAANHVSYIDPFAMAFFHEDEICVVARDTLMSNPFSKLLLSSMNAIPIKRGDSRNLGVFRQLLSYIKEGKSVLIFPEGTRSGDGTLLRGKAGVGLLAMKAGVPIVPIRSWGFEEFFPRSNKLRGGGRIIMQVGKPIQLSEIDPGKNCAERAQVIVDNIMQRIAEIKKPKLYNL